MYACLNSKYFRVFFNQQGYYSLIISYFYGSNKKNDQICFKKVPHTYTIVFFIIVICAVLTWIVPGGEYERTTRMVNNVERTIIVDNSFHQVENHPQTWEIFSALFNGFEKQAGIIIFILMLGGAFWIMNASKAIDVGIFSFLKFAKGLEKNKLVRKLGVNNIILTPDNDNVLSLWGNFRNE